MGLREAAVVTAIMVAVLAAGCDELQQDAAPAAKAPPPRVVVATVVRKDVTPSTTFVGRVEAIESVVLIARVEGFLEERNFVEGGEVKEGDLLFMIEQAPYQAEVQRMKADLVSAEATLKNAKLSLERTRTLAKKGTVPRAKLDDNVAEEGRAEGAVMQAKAALKQAELNLSYTQILAPIGGRIGRANYSKGNLVGPSTGALAELVNLDPIYVRINVSDRDLLQSRRGSFDGSGGLLTPHLQLDDGTRYEQEGKFSFVNNRVDPQTDTILVRATFPNPDSVLLPDQFVTVIVERSEPVSALVVPQASIQEDQTSRYVLTLDKDNKVQVSRVTLGKQEGIDWIVKEGLEEGEHVIVQGLQKVHPGVTVDPVSESGADKPVQDEGEASKEDTKSEPGKS